jgi:hypothetical protein
MFIFLNLLLVAAVWAYDEGIPPPDCYLCDYNDNIGYVKDPNYCGVYFVCYRNPYKDGDYKSQLLCCPEGLAWDAEHLGCTYNKDDCIEHDYCPDIIAPPVLDCPYFANIADPTQYFTPTQEVLTCPKGTLWDQYLCTCIDNGEHVVPCDKIMHFHFTGSYDSFSCNNVVDGTPNGSPSLDQDVLCLNGEDEFLTIAYFNNWFAWNPLSDSFTLCLWIQPKEDGESRGVFASNCYYGEGEQVSVLDLWLDFGQLIARFGSKMVYTQEFLPAGVFSKVCVTFDAGHYELYIDGVLLVTEYIMDPLPINSQVPATLGYVTGKDTFLGYIDDFCFWTRALSADEILKCYIDGPSNEYSDDGDDPPTTTTA